MLRLFFILLINSFIDTSWASNDSRELEYADAIESSLSIGGIAWLKIKDKRFLSLYTETEKTNNVGTAIILHPIGGHPDQAKLIRPLRSYLPEHNWASLSLQMPVLEFGSKEQDYYSLFNDANTRIEAALEFLVSAGAEHIVLIGYGLGGMMAVYYLKENSQTTAVKALVTVSLPVPKTTHKNAQISNFISEIKQPFLDLFISSDLTEVIDSARKKRIAGNANKLYRQLKIDGEEPLLQYNDNLIVKRIYSWMSRTFKEDIN